jgi:hypothetical protein
MKNIVFLFFTVLVLPLKGQNFAEKYFPVKDNDIFYQDVVNVDGATISDMFLKAKTWAAETFVDSKEVIQVEDKEAGLLVLKGVIKSSGHNAAVRDAKHWFQLKIDFKDGKYRYTLNEIQYDFNVAVLDVRQDYSFNFYEWLIFDETNLSKRKREKVAEGMSAFLPGIDEKFKAIIASLERKIKASGDDDW